jgi:hypothetical protein
MTIATTVDEEARSDRRVILIALSLMIALVLFGVGFGSFFAATNCRQLRPIDVTVPVTAAQGDAARTLLAESGLGPDGIVAAEELLGALVSAVRLPIDAPIRIGALRTPGSAAEVAGVLVTGDGVVRVDAAGDVVAGAVFRRAVTVVGDGPAVYALVVGNTLTGQVDALRPLLPGGDADGIGFGVGTCVDTSAVGSPLSFLHDARDGQLLGLRTDEDGSESVLELRDPTRGRIWAPVVELPRAPAGLQGSRTSAAIGPDTIVMVRRFAESSEGSEGGRGAVRAYGRGDGALLWQLDASAVRSALPPELVDEVALRLEVAYVDDVVAHLSVWPDVPADALLPLPTHGPLGELQQPDPRTVMLTIDLRSGDVVRAEPGAGVGRDGSDRASALAALRAVSGAVDDVLPSPQGTWVLVGRSLARFGG